MKRSTVTARHDGLEYADASLCRTDLIPNYLSLDQLYLRLFVAASRYCAGERRHLFW